MIQFNKLGISGDGKQLVIDVQVIDSYLYDNIYIESITIGTKDNYTSTGIDTNYIYQSQYTNQKQVSLLLDTLDLNNTVIKENLLFIYVKATGVPHPDTPCGLDKEITTAAIVDTYSLYELGMGFLRQVEKDCVLPKDFINFILEQKAFELALKTGNFLQAIKYWDKFFKERQVSKSISCC